MKRTKIIFGFIIVAAAVVMAVKPAAQAQSNGDIKVDPIYQEIIIKPNPDRQNFSIKLTNNTKIAQSFSLKTVDFGSLNETGGVAFIGVNSPDLSYKYALSPWLEVDQPQITIGPGQTYKVALTIKDISAMSPGGHYGAIFVQPLKTGTNKDKSKVELSQVVSSLVLAKKVGGEIYNLELKSVQFDHSANKLPSIAVLRFYNGGNVHLVPRGVVSIKDANGKIISEGLINANSGYILPEANRQITVPLLSRATQWWPGYVNLEVKYRFDGYDRFTIKSQKIFYLGKAISVGLPIILILVGIAFFVVKKRVWKTKKMKS